MKRQIALFFVLFWSVMMTGCVGACNWREPVEGTVEVKTIRGNITRIIRPSDGAPWEEWYGDDYHIVDMTTVTTDEVLVSGSSKDNAALTMKVVVTSKVMNDDNSIMAYVRKFGVTDQKSRHDNRNRIIMSQINTETKNVVAEFPAYEILANQEKIQANLYARLKQIFSDQLYMDLETVQIIGRPDFVDDRIENAAAAVVAANKEREAAEAEKQKAVANKERREIEAQTFSNPAIFKLEELKMMKEIETVRADGIAKHQGPLTIVYDGQKGNIQVQSQK